MRCSVSDMMSLVQNYSVPVVRIHCSAFQEAQLSELVILKLFIIIAAHLDALLLEILPFCFESIVANKHYFVFCQVNLIFPISRIVN